jgi:RND family efflux transporter MFP subunit
VAPVEVPEPVQQTPEPEEATPASRPRHRRHVWRWFIVPGLAGVIALFQVLFGSESQSVAASTGDVAVVERGSLAVHVLATGRVEPALQAQIRSRVGGVVAEVLVNEGQVVKKGDVLLRIDPIDYSREVERHSAEVMQRRAEHRLAQQRLATIEKGLQQRVLAAVEKDNAQAEMSMARGRLKAALVEERAARDRVRYATLVAPFDGTIINRAVQPGEMVVPTGNVEGRPLLVIGDTSTLIVRTELNQVDFARVGLGNKAKVTFDALPGSTFTAEVTALPASSLRNGSGAETFPIQLRLQAAKDLARVKPGMSAEVEISLPRKEGVLLVPLEAIHTDGSKRTVEVWAAESQSYQSRVVQTGEHDEQKVEILSGIKVGETVGLGSKPASKP